MAQHLYMTWNFERRFLRVDPWFPKEFYWIDWPTCRLFHFSEAVAVSWFQMVLSQNPFCTLSLRTLVHYGSNQWVRRFVKNLAPHSWSTSSCMEVERAAQWNLTSELTIPGHCCHTACFWWQQRDFLELCLVLCWKHAFYFYLATIFDRESGYPVSFAFRSGSSPEQMSRWTYRAPPSSFCALFQCALRRPVASTFLWTTAPLACHKVRDATPAPPCSGAGTLGCFCRALLFAHS